MFKNKNMLLASLVLATSMGALGLSYLPHPEHSNIQNNDVIVDVHSQNGIALKNLSTSVNTLGHVTQTITYTVTPDDASIKDVIAEVKYSDGTSCADVMTVSVDNSKKAITLTCLKDFGKKIKLVVSSKSTPSVTAEAVIDYEKKITGVRSRSNVIDLHLSHAFSLDSFAIADVDTSLFTKDKNDYSFTMSGGTVSNIVNPTSVAFSTEADNKFITSYVNKLKEVFMKNTLVFKNNRLYIETNAGSSSSYLIPKYGLTASEIWNLTTDNGVHEKLSQYWNNGEQPDQWFDENSNLQFTIQNLLVKVGNQSFKIDVKIKDSLIKDYSSNMIPVSSISLESSNLVF